MQKLGCGLGGRGHSGKGDGVMHDDGCALLKLYLAHLTTAHFTLDPSARGRLCVWPHAGPPTCCGPAAKRGASQAAQGREGGRDQLRRASRVARGGGGGGTLAKAGSTAAHPR